MVYFKIKEICSQKGVTQKALSEIIGISTTSLSRIITSEQTPTLGTLQKIATALNVDITELFKTSDKIGSSSHLVCPHCGTHLHITLEEEDSNEKGTAANDKEEAAINKAKGTAATNKGKGTAATDSTENASEDWDSALKEGLANF